MADNSPKHSQETWNAIKLEYQAGSYKTLKELASRYEVHPNTLRTHIHNEKWSEEQSALQNKVKQVMVEKTVDLASEYLSNTFKRAKRLEKIADASLSQASLNNDGIPLVDLEQVDILTRSELRIHELAKSCLRIAPVQQAIQVSGSVSLVSIIADLRKQVDAPRLPNESIDRIIDLADDKAP